MFTAIKDNKIIAYNNTGKFPCLVYDEITQVEDAELVEVGGEFVLKTDDKAVAKQKDDVRAVRNQYLETYVDPKQMVLVWDGLSDNDKLLYSAYRTYLLDYPESSATWYENDPLNYDDWATLNSATVLNGGGVMPQLIKLTVVSAEPATKEAGITYAIVES